MRIPAGFKGFSEKMRLHGVMRRGAWAGGVEKSGAVDAARWSVRRLALSLRTPTSSSPGTSITRARSLPIPALRSAPHRSQTALHKNGDRPHGFHHPP